MFVSVQQSKNKTKFQIYLLTSKPELVEKSSYRVDGLCLAKYLGPLQYYERGGSQDVIWGRKMEDVAKRHCLGNRRDCGWELGQR